MANITIIGKDKTEYSLVPESVLSNNVIFGGEYNPHNVRPWIIGNEYGAICLVWAENEQEALDVMVDSGLGDSFLIDEYDTDVEDLGDYSFLGNAGEVADLSNAWIVEVEIMKQSMEVIIMFAKAVGANVDDLSQV